MGLLLLIGAIDLLFVIELCMSTLSCADVDGATLNLYSPLFRWEADEGEKYHESLMRRMREILVRTRDNPQTAYFGAIWYNYSYTDSKGLFLTSFSQGAAPT